MQWGIHIKLIILKQIYSAWTICTWQDRFNQVSPFEKELAWHKQTECIKSLTRLLKNLIILSAECTQGTSLSCKHIFCCFFGPHCHNYAFWDHKKCIQMCQDAPFPSTKEKKYINATALLDDCHCKFHWPTDPPAVPPAVPSLQPPTVNQWHIGHTYPMPINSWPNDHGWLH